MHRRLRIIETIILLHYVSPSIFLPPPFHCLKIHSSSSLPRLAYFNIHLPASFWSFPQSQLNQVWSSPKKNLPFLALASALSMTSMLRPLKSRRQSLSCFCESVALACSNHATSSSGDLIWCRSTMWCCWCHHGGGRQGGHSGWVDKQDKNPTEIAAKSSSPTHLEEHVAQGVHVDVGELGAQADLEEGFVSLPEGACKTGGDGG